MSKVGSIRSKIFSYPRTLLVSSVLGASALAGYGAKEMLLPIAQVQAESVENEALNKRGIYLNVDEVLKKVKSDEIKDATLWGMGRASEYEFKLTRGGSVYCVRPEDAKEVEKLENGLKTLGSKPIFAAKGVESKPFEYDRLLPAALVLFVMALLAIAAKSQLGSSMFKAAKSDKTFDDIRGYPQLVKKLETIIDYMKNRDEYEIPCKIPKGILMTGKPGTGKTLLAKIIAGEAEVPFYPVKGSDFVQMFAGVGATRLRSLFKKAKQTGGIIFIDEIDAMAPKRELNQGASGKEYTQLLTELLTQMDGFDETNNVMVIGSTNRPDILDEALVRSGRFDIHLNVYPPFTVKDRREILDLYIEPYRKINKLAPDVDIDSITENTVGFVGADLENLVNRAALLANQQKPRLKQITQEMFNSAMTEIKVGIKHDTVVTEEDMLVSCIHEFSGHAFVGKILGRIIERISAEPWGESLGHVRFSPKGHSELLPNYRELVEDLIGLMAGRAAEMHVLPPGKHTLGARGDYTQARNIIRQMITSGMFKSHNSSDYTNPLKELTEKDAELTDKVIDNALDVALKLISQKSREEHEAWVKSIIDKKEVAGEKECAGCVAEILDGLDVDAIYREVAEPFIEACRNGLENKPEDKATV